MNGRSRLRMRCWRSLGDFDVMMIGVVKERILTFFSSIDDEMI